MRELRGKREEVDSCTGQGSPVSPLGPDHCHAEDDCGNDCVEDNALLMMIMFVHVGHSLLWNST